MGFFTQVPRTQGTGFTGSGTLTSFLYTGEKLEMHLARVDPGTLETLTASLNVTLPPMSGAPLVTGAQVTVLVLDDGQTRPSRAFTVRDTLTGDLLLAADMRFGSTLLAGADLEPIGIATSPEIVGCRQDGCGKLLFDRTLFAADGKSVVLEPGQQGDLALNAGLYRFLNVSSGSYSTTRCDFASLRPYLFWRQEAP